MEFQTTVPATIFWKSPQVVCWPRFPRKREEINGFTKEAKQAAILSLEGVVAMSARSMEQQTYLPEPAEEIAELLSFLSAHEMTRGARPEPRYLLAGAEEGDHVEMPAAVHAVLLQVLQAMKAGKAVTVAPHSKLLTTQQAADLLGVSRPTVVRLIDDGVLPGEVAGTRRRMVKLDDLLRYREQRRDQQYEALMATAADYDADLEDPDVLEERLRRVRAEAAARRRSSTA